MSTEMYRQERLYQVRSRLLLSGGAAQQHVDCFGAAEHSMLWEWELAKQCLRQFCCVWWKLWMVPNYKCASTSNHPELCCVSNDIHLSFTAHLYNVKVTILACQKRHYLCAGLWPIVVAKHQVGMQWKGTSVVFQCAIVPVNAADRTSSGKSIEPQRKAFCGTLLWISVGTSPPAEDISQDELLFT